MFSKFILSLLIINSVSFLLFCSAEIDENMRMVAQMIHDECVENSGVSTEVIDKIFSTKTFMPDEKFKCYLKCTLQQISAMDDNGDLDREVFIGTMPEEYKEFAIEVVEKCSHLDVSDPCEKAYQMNVCAQKVNPDKYEFI